jgi:heme-degrading monooxygenase HmoA
MIARIWHGYTSKSNADIYENLLRQEVFIEIEKKNVNGYKGIQLLKRDLENETEFTTIMWFEDIKSVKQFAGNDYEKSYVPAKARKILKRFDATAIHCELIHNLNYNDLK